MQLLHRGASLGCFHVLEEDVERAGKDVECRKVGFESTYCI